MRYPAVSVKHSRLLGKDQAAGEEHCMEADIGLLPCTMISGIAPARSIDAPNSDYKLIGLGVVNPVKQYPLNKPITAKRR